MENRDGRTLLRTMSFISSRARAIRQRFGTSQPSLTDNWQGASGDAFINDDPRLPSPDMGGSMMSLLDEPVTPWQEQEDARSSVFRAQRSRSLDSLGAVPIGATLSPPGNLPVLSAPRLPSSPTAKIPRPIVPKLPESPNPQFSIQDFPGSLSPISQRFPDSVIPKIPGPPPSPIKTSTLSAPTTPRHGEPYSPLTPRFPEYPIIPRIPGPPPSPKVSRPSTPSSKAALSPVTPRLTDASFIPKIPGPPVSPKHSRPSTPKNLEYTFPELPKSQSAMVIRSSSRPSTPKQQEPTMTESHTIPKLPGPPPHLKLSRPSTPKSGDESLLEDEEGGISVPGASTKPPLPPNHLSVVCDTHEFPKFSAALQQSFRKPLKRCTTLPVRERDDDIVLLTEEETKPSLSVSRKPSQIPESESFDVEENRDKVSEGCLPTRPTLFDLRPRPKLKHQWSMDESRVAAAGRESGGMKPAEKRRRFFMRKQTNSAPDSFDGPGHLNVKHKEHHSVSFCLGNVRKCRGSDSSIQPPTLPTIKLEPELGVEHLADLRYPDGDPPCHFCCQQTSTSIHDENRLKIVSGGLVRSRDGSRDDTGTHYMNLPSPNVQNEGEKETVFHPREAEEPAEARRSREAGAVAGPGALAGAAAGEGDEEEAPPASALTRRRALVPPKLMTDAADDRKLSAGSNCSSPRARRSSIVVIPPMQICPGDLLVYSKVLTQRNNLLDIDGSTTSLAVSDTDGVNSRKGKNTWSLLRLFERSSRGKSGSLCGLEEVLNCLPRTDFDDEQLSRFRGMCWSEFIHYCENKTTGEEKSGSSSGSTSSPSSPEPPPQAPSPPPPPPLAPSPPPRQRLRGNLVRAQSERCFERKLIGARAMWKGFDRTLPLRPSPLVSTLSEKDLLVSPVSTTSRIESKRREAVWDLFQSECAFLYDHLMVLKNVFMEPLKKIQVEGFAMFAEPELLFGNLDELCCVTYAFCKEFISLLLENVGPGGELPTTDVLVKLFQKSTEADSVSQAYHCYALNYINALNYLETLRRHMEFCEFEKWCSRDPRCKKLQLTDLLVAPVQHIMKVPLILKEVETRTEEPAERELIAQILEIEENSIRELDDKMKWLKNFERLLEIQRNIVWPSVFELDPKIYVPEFLKPALTRQLCDRIIVSPRRQIIIEGPLQLWDSGKPQEMFVILFDDMLLITRKKKGLSKKKSSLSENWASSCSRGSTSSESSMRYIVYKQPLSLDRFFIHDVTVPESASCRLEAAFVLVSLNRFQQVVTIHTFQAPSDQVKQTWLLKLRDTQDKWKRTLQHTVFRSPRLSTCSAKSST